MRLRVRVGMTAAALVVIGALRAGAESSIVDRGRYLFAISGGCGCHTPEDGPLNSGGRATETDFGVFFGTNITPDPVHGIGSWTDDEIIASIREGVRSNGDRLSPVMPYRAYAGLAEGDVRALVAFLRSVPAAARPNRPHDLAIPFFGVASRLWGWLHGAAGDVPARAPRVGVARGRYLVEHVAHCPECHTPRTVTGGLDRSLDLSGAIVEGEVAGNLTPDPETGLGEWSEGDVADLLQTGFLPNADNVQGLMALLIDGLPLGYKDLERSDAIAIAKYLKSIRPIHRRVEKPEEDG